MTETWDLVVVGAGPAGTTAALGALSERPGLRVLLLDRSDFPRDKACGDGIAPHVLDVLEQVGVTGLFDDQVPVSTLELARGDHSVVRAMARPGWVVPRLVLDHRLVQSAVAAGAVLRRHRIGSVTVEPDAVVLDGEIRGRVVVGADGAYSVMRQAVGLGPARRRALALRGYAPTRPAWVGRQVIVFSETRQSSYAWSFDRGDGFANVGYGELLHAGRPAHGRADLMGRLAELLPGAMEDGTAWRGHHLPLSSWRHRQPDGRVLLAGDAAGLINPMTGEGIYYAVATGVVAGRSAVQSLDGGNGQGAGAACRVAVRSLLGRHLVHTSVASRLVGLPAVVNAGIGAAARNQAVFDDLVEIGLGRGRITGRLLGGLVASGRDDLRFRR